MKPEEIKDLIMKSLSSESSPDDLRDKLEDAGVSYTFSDGFNDKVLDRLFKPAVVINLDTERSWNRAFYKIALSGAAAIVILLISIYVSEGTFSLDSLLGLSSGSDESIVSLLTGM
jgi:type IV secretory pathway VirB4 component